MCMITHPARRPAPNLFRKLRRDDRGLALIEFAYVTPILLMLMTCGAELANYAITSMRLSALALQVADNAARIGEGDPMSSKKISEAQVNDLLQGAMAQGGSLRINGTYAQKQANGSTATRNKARIIISSLEPDLSNAGKSYIHWQRCYGQATAYTPQYGVQGANNLSGMGPAGRQVEAPPNTAMIFVEVYYDYEPLFPLLRPGMFGIMNYRKMSSVAAMMVRDDRDLAQLYNNEAVTASTCSST